jgi:taurine dioxygenase/pentalenolactone F synthase
MTLEIRPLAEPLGAIVHGWNPTAELSSQDRADILQSLRQYQVLVFRAHDQPSDIELVQFARNFGDLVKGSEWFGDIGEHAEILPVNNLFDGEGVPMGTGGSAALEWHTDYSYVSTVGKESFLEASELPASAPQTCFCSQYVALETLPRKTVDMLRPLRAFHSIGYIAAEKPEQDSAGSSARNELREGFRAKKARNEKLGLKRPRIPEAEHPVIVRHPDSGREILYVNPGITRHIVGMPRDESDALLKELHVHSTRASSVYAHDWQLGDMVVFDTLGTLHRRDAWDPAERRAMRQLSTLWDPSEAAVS